MSAGSPHHDREPSPARPDTQSEDLEMRASQRSPRNGAMQNSPLQSGSLSLDHLEKSTVEMPSRQRSPEETTQRKENRSGTKGSKTHVGHSKGSPRKSTIRMLKKDDDLPMSDADPSLKSTVPEEMPPQGQANAKKRQPRESEKSDQSKPRGTLQPKSQGLGHEIIRPSCSKSVPLLPLPPPVESARAQGKPIISRRKIDHAHISGLRGSYDGFSGLPSAQERPWNDNSLAREAWQIGGWSKASVPQADFLSRPCKQKSVRDLSVSTSPSSGAGTPERPPTWMRGGGDIPDWQDVLCALTAKVADKDTQYRLFEVKSRAEKDGVKLAERMQEDRTLREVKCRRAHPFKASPKLLEIQKVERILAGKKQFEQAAAVQRQAAELEKKEREKHRTELGDRLSILDQTLVEKEEAEAAAHGRRVLENLWEMGLSNRLPLNELQKLCVKAQGGQSHAALGSHVSRANGARSDVS
eukprot:CAMPEP_0194506470 /NCGR_PEP_ID=MMETSP0253-20130528/35001_1 /TAXON_ID=2966 /ORGANISM="Noctiluca scintillans" /LENGTH=468 /DNA_ID=CAMNT_0039349221 /DNA_START=24 /DNA_END=1430 /DNA_ORIENTATION=+